MFNKILIKSGSNVAEHFLSIADVVDMMFYYGEVHVVVSQFELNQLLKYFGEDVLYELIVSNRLIVHPCDQHIGAILTTNGYISLGLWSHQFKSLEELIFYFYKASANDYKENERFARKFSNVLNEYQYPKGINDSLFSDIENENLLSQSTQVFIKQYYPDYKNVEDIHLKAQKTIVSPMPLYKIEGNLRINELNDMHQRNGYSGTFGYSTVLIALGETNVDCYMAAELQAEMIGNNRWSEVYKLRMNEAMKQAEGNKNNINRFQEMVANDYLSPGQSFVDGLISPIVLLKDLNSSDSVKFRSWLSTIPEGTPLTGELYKDIQNLNSSKKWVKAVRSIAQICFGAINPIFGVATTFLDGFVADKMVNGWKPTMFVSNILNKDIMKKNS